MTKIDITTASTADLLAFFNAHSGAAPVKRFSDRKTAERRVAALIATTTPAEPAPARRPRAIIKFVQAYAENGSPVCPACGGTEDVTTGEVRELHGKQHIINDHIACHHGCGHEWNTRTGRPARRASDKTAADRSAAIAESWKNAAVAAARATRHGVRVTDPRGGSGVYRSVHEAFVALNLPLGRHIKFRGQLKAAGSKEFEGFQFKIVEV